MEADAVSGDLQGAPADDTELITQARRSGVWLSAAVQPTPLPRRQSVRFCCKTL